MGNRKCGNDCRECGDCEPGLTIQPGSADAAGGGAAEGLDAPVVIVERRGSPKGTLPTGDVTDLARVKTVYEVTNE